MKEKDKEEFRELIRETIQEKVNGKIDRMQDKLDEHIAVMEPVIDLINGSIVARKLIIWITSIIIAITSATMALKQFN